MSNAVLFYGFPIHRHGDQHFQRQAEYADLKSDLVTERTGGWPDASDEVKRRLGLVWPSYPGPKTELAQRGKYPEYDAATDAYFASERSWGCEVYRHGNTDSGDIWFSVVISDSKHYAEEFDYDATPTKIPAEKLIAEPDWNAKLEAYCAKLGVPYRQPSWFLASKQ